MIEECFASPTLLSAKSLYFYLESFGLSKSDKDRAAYDRHIDNIMVQNDVLGTSKLEGLIQEREEGRAEGKTEVARNLKQKGLPLDNIMRATGLTKEEINAL